MAILRSTSNPSGVGQQPSTGRRSFVWRLGAATSALLASAVPGMASRRKDQGSRSRSDVDQPSRRLGLLEDELAIRRLHETYEICLDSGFYEDVVDLFTEDGEVAFNGGVFDGRGRGVRRLYVDRFRSVRAGKRIEVPPGSELDARQQPAVVTVATDRKSAQARFAYSIQVGAPIVSDSQLARMARLHGEGILRWWEGGTYVASYAKDVSDGGWRMRRLEFQVQSRAAHGRGRSGATPIPVPVFSKAFPEDPAGPDRLVSQAETSQNA